MPRSIFTQRGLDVLAPARSSSPAPSPDGYGSRVLKYIPAEVVTVYIAVQGVINAADPAGPNATLLWVAFGILLVLTPVYLWRIMHVTKSLQLVISTIAFAVWVFSLGGPFAFFPWYQAVYGAVLLPLFTFAVGIIIPNGGPGA
jgi:hypothetical protein